MTNRTLYGELGELTRYIETTMRQLRSVDVPVASTAAQLPEAAGHLTDLARLTEEGTHRVMELAEAIQDNRRAASSRLHELAAHAGDGPAGASVLAHAAAIERLLTEDDKRLVDIMTALSFQDLVAQRIKKIVAILEDVEHKLLEMVVVFGQKEAGAAGQPGKADQMLKELEASKATALKQDLVDEILGQFGFQ
ncbi:protein phosphatase CheZ [Candidatus Nitrospira bockiana]